jgi:membrane-associated phospholipid phosphatase
MIQRRNVSPQTKCTSSFVFGYLPFGFSGGLLLVYTGNHFVTELLAGYLIGASAAGCAIGLLAQNEAKRKQWQPKETVPGSDSISC